MPSLLIIGSTGPTDPTRASIPFHIAANGAVPAGAECSVALAGDAVALVKPEVSTSVIGVGVPPLMNLLAACAERGVRIHV
jgi:predicted peroxiredoxin